MRLADCPRRTGELAERTPLPAGAGVGRGYACGIYEEKSFVGRAPTLCVDPATGAIDVHRRAFRRVAVECHRVQEERAVGVLEPALARVAARAA